MISDLKKMREDVEEIYKKGTFYSSIDKEIISVLGLEDPKIDDKVAGGLVTVEGENIPSTGTMVGTRDNPIVVSTGKSTKNFKEALRGVEGKENKKEEVCNRTMKPLPIPRY